MGDRDEDKGGRGCAGVDIVARGGAEWNHLRIRARSGLGDLSWGLGRTPLVRSSGDWNKWAALWAPFSGLWMIPLVDDQSKLGLLGDRWGSSERLLVMDRLMTSRNGHPLIDAIFEVILEYGGTYRFGAKRNILL